MTYKEASENLYEIMLQFKRSVIEAEIGDEYALEAQAENQNAVQADRL